MYVVWPLTNKLGGKVKRGRMGRRLCFGSDTQEAQVSPGPWPSVPGTRQSIGRQEATLVVVWLTIASC